MNDNHPIFAHQQKIATRLAEILGETAILSQDPYTPPDFDKHLQCYTSAWKRRAPARNLVRFYRKFFHILKAFRPSVVFSHMTDTQAALIAPFCWFFNIPHVIWYAHKSNSWQIRFAALFADVILTSTKGSCGLQSRKVLAIGQGIDISLFPFSVCNSKFERGVTWGRRDESKRIPHIIEVFSTLIEEGLNCYIDLYGSPSSYEESEKWNRFESGLQSTPHHDRFRFHSSISRKKIVDTAGGYDFFVHAFQGSLDKSLVEATLIGLPVITENIEYLQEFGFWCDSVNSSLRDQMLAIRSISPKILGEELIRRRALAEKNHGLNGWLDKVASILLEEV